VPYRGKRNEPSYLAATARTVAELQGVTVEELGRVTAENARRVFALP
jgi:TatD DNase family protein